MSTLLTFPATARGDVSATFHDHTFGVLVDNHVIAVRDNGSGVFAGLYPNPTLTPVLDKLGRLQYTYSGLYFGFLRYSELSYTFGIITEDTFIDVIIWNSVLEGYSPVTVTDIIEPTDASLAVVAVETPPYVMSHLGEYIYRINATVTGNPTVADAITFNYDTQDNITLEITGLRVVLFSYAPDWAGSVEQTYSYNTNILESINGAEQRIKLRAYPRISMKYDFLAEASNSRELSNNLIGWGDKPFAMPMWHECVKTKSISAIGQTHIELTDTTGTYAGYTTLVYLPFTGKVHLVGNITNSISPNAVTIQDTFVAAQSIDESRSYHINDVNLLIVSVTGTLDNLTFVTITSDDTEIAFLNNQTVDNTTEYFIKGNNVHVQVATGAQDPPTDIVIDVRDNAETSTVALTSVLDVTIPAGEKVYACVLGFVTSIDSYNAHHDSLKGVSVTMSSEPLTSLPELITSPQYKGSLVETRNPDWRDGQKQDIARTLFLQDNKYGVLNFGRESEFIGSKLGRNDTLWDARNIKQFKEEMQRRSGRLRPFWLPTFTSDIIINTLGTFDQTFIIIEDNDNALVFNRTQDYRNIRIEFSSGAILYREILSIVSSGSNLQMNIDTSLGVDFIPEDIRLVSYMSFVRGDFDSTAFTWEHNSLVTIQQTFKGVVQ